jgi:PhnB protein
MKAANSYLNFNGNTEEAFNYYKSVFGGDFVSVVRFKDFQDNSMGVSEKDKNKIAHIALPLADGSLLMGTDVVESMGKPVIMGNNYYITLEAESSEEADKIFNGLSAGGNVEMPLQKTEWAEKYGSCVDKFGVQWMVDYTGDVQFPG